MNRKIRYYQTGLTLIELLTVMVVLVALASVTVSTTTELAFENRYEITKDRYEKIKKAIIGDQHQIINGMPNIEGFVKDVGRLPFALQELLIEGFCSDTGYFDNASCTTAGATWTNNGYGWKGPYINTDLLGTDQAAISDGWGNTGTGNYGWNVIYYSNSSCTTVTTTINSTTGGIGATCMDIQSLGMNQATGGTGYDEDFPVTQPAIKIDDWTVDVNNIEISIPAVASLTPPVCIQIVKNSFFSNSIASNVLIDTTSPPIRVPVQFAINLNSFVPMGKAWGIIYQDANCTSTASNPINSISPSLSYASINNPICINVNDNANFTSTNCTSTPNNGKWIDDGTEQYCDLVSGTNCSGPTAPQLGGTEFKRFEVMLIPHATLPTIYW